MPIKTFQEYISEAAVESFYERLQKNPNTVRFIHALALGHPESRAAEVAERGGEITAPRKPVQHSYRKIADIAAAYHDPDNEKPFDTKSVQRLIHGHLKVPQRTVQQRDSNYEAKIEAAGGIDKIMKQRKQGMNDRQIFPGHGRRVVSRLRSYIEKKYKDHPNYASRVKPKQKKASTSMVDDIMTRKARGESYGKIANHYRITRSRVAGLIHRNKVLDKSSGRGYSLS